MQKTGLTRVMREVPELSAIRGVAERGIGYLYAGHARDIPVRSSSVPDR